MVNIDKLNDIAEPRSSKGLEMAKARKLKRNMETKEELKINVIDKETLADMGVNNSGGLGWTDGDYSPFKGIDGNDYQYYELKNDDGKRIYLIAKYIGYVTEDEMERIIGRKRDENCGFY